MLTLLDIGLLGGGVFFCLGQVVLQLLQPLQDGLAGLFLELGPLLHKGLLELIGLDAGVTIADTGFVGQASISFLRVTSPFSGAKRMPAQTPRAAPVIKPNKDSAFMVLCY